jgi:hypothetical protein
MRGVSETEDSLLVLLRDKIVGLQNSCKGKYREMDLNLKEEFIGSRGSEGEGEGGDA